MFFFGEMARKEKGGEGAGQGRGEERRRTSDHLVDVHIHELEHECQAPRHLIEEHLFEGDDAAVLVQAPQRLDLSAHIHSIHK